MFDYHLSLSRQIEIRRSFPESAEAWIANYSNLLRECEDQWGLDLVDTITTGWPTNTVYFSDIKRGEPRALKVCHPHEEVFTEMRTLAFFAGRHMVPLIDTDEEKGALLLHRVLPGMMLREQINKPESIRDAIILLRELPLREVTPLQLPSVEGWLNKAFSSFELNFPKDVEYLSFIREAESCLAKIKSLDESRWVLHGDLHHENILKSESGWLAIDPKGVIGPKVFECGRFLHNFLTDELASPIPLRRVPLEQLVDLLRRRYRTAAEILGASYDMLSLARVTMIDVTMCVCWSINSHHFVVNSRADDGADLGVDNGVTNGVTNGAESGAGESAAMQSILDGRQLVRAASKALGSFELG